MENRYDQRQEVGEEIIALDHRRQKKGPGEKRK